MKQRNVCNQTELDQALKEGFTPVISSNESFVLVGETSVQVSGSSQPRVVCSGSSQPRVVCYGSSQPRVVCSDSSQPRVECYGSSQPRVVCYGSSQPRVVCSDSSQPRVECSDSSQPRVECYGSSQPRVVCSDSSQPRVECSDSSQPRVVCSGYAQVSATGAVRIKAKSTNQITVEGPAKVVGGKVIRIKNPKTAAEWCAVNGVSVTRGVAILFKGLDDSFKSNHNGFEYKPGTIPIAPDWDGGTAECGGGLHFCARPAATLKFHNCATRFCACPVRLKDIRPPKADDSHPTKVKARGCCAPIWECDPSGEKI
jgi:hypothetical protein